MWIRGGGWGSNGITAGVRRFTPARHATGIGERDALECEAFGLTGGFAIAAPSLFILATGRAAFLHRDAARSDIGRQRADFFLSLIHISEPTTPY